MQSNIRKSDDKAENIEEAILKEIKLQNQYLTNEFREQMLLKEKEIDALKYKNHELMRDVNAEKQINEKLLQIISEELGLKYKTLDEEISFNYSKKESTLSNLLQQVNTLYDGIINILEKQDRLIDENKNKTKQIQTLQEEVALKDKEVDYYKKRYNAMSNSKLGKLQTKYWAMKRK